MIFARADVKQECKALLAQGLTDGSLEEAIVAGADVKQECKALLVQGPAHSIMEEVIVSRADLKQACKALLVFRAPPTASWRRGSSLGQT